jgi:hypothetical protein
VLIHACHGRLPPELADHLSSLFEHVFDQLHPIIHRLALRDVTEREELLNHSDILFLWSRVILFGKYVNQLSATLSFLRFTGIIF